MYCHSLHFLSTGSKENHHLSKEVTQILICVEPLVNAGSDLGCVLFWALGYVIRYPELVKYLKKVKFSQKYSQSHSIQGHRALTNRRMQIKTTWHVSWKGPVSGPKEQTKSVNNCFPTVQKLGAN